MIRPRLGLRAVGLCLALAGLMAVGPSSAQAEATSYWLVNGIKVTLLLPELAGSLENNHGQLLGEIGGTGIHILCTGITLMAGNHLLAEGGWLGKVRFNGCIVRQLKTLNVPSSLVTLPFCEPPGGIIETTTGKGLIRLTAAKTPITVLEPNAGTLLASFATSELCAFGEKIEIGGKLAVKDCKNAFLTDQMEHLVEEVAENTELYLNNNKGNKATLDGSAIIRLAGGHNNMTWAGHPG